MTYFTDRSQPRPFASLTAESLCFECGESIEKESVSYDGHAVDGTLKSIYFHPSCAALVGQRLICDGFPNRRRG